MKILIDAFMYIFEAWLFLIYSNSVFEASKGLFKRITIVVASSILLFAVYQLNITYVNAILVTLVLTVLFKYLYNASLGAAIFHSFIFSAMMFVSELLIMLISSVIFKDFNSLENDFNAYIFVIVLSKLLLFIIMIMLSKVFARKDNNEGVNSAYWLLFIMPVSSIMMLLVIRYVTYTITLNSKMKLLIFISCVLMLFSNVIIFAIYEYSLKENRELYQLQMMEYKDEQDKQYYGIIEQSNKEFRIFAHDTKNHLLQLINIDDHLEKEEYIENLIGNIDKFTYIGISENKMLDLILSKYISLCEKENICFTIDVKTANLSYIEDSDLTALMNNLLDNAIEAAKDTDNKFIDLKIFNKNKNYDVLIIANSSGHKPISKNGILKTTKTDFHFHGIGTQSIKKVLKKYRADYDWDYDELNKVFTSNIIFNR